METIDKKAKFAQIAFLMASLPLNQWAKKRHCSDEIVLGQCRLLTCNIEIHQVTYDWGRADLTFEPALVRLLK